MSHALVTLINNNAFNLSDIKALEYAYLDLVNKNTCKYGNGLITLVSL